MRTEYTRAANDLISWIKQNGYAPGARLPSVRSLAEKTKLKLSTANRACLWLIGQGFLRREGQRLFLSHSPEPVATVVHPIYIVSFHGAFLRACGRYLTQRGYDFRLTEVATSDRYAVMRAALDLAHRPRAGLIVAPRTNDEETVNQLKTLQGPLLVRSDLEWGEDFTVVGLDLQRGVEKALKHLIAQGHHEVAHVSCSRKESSDQRLATIYRNVCLYYGLRFSANRLWQSDQPDSRLLRRLLQSKRRENPEVTAIFGDDRVGIAATEIFAIPDELSFVGFYNLDESAKTRPPLTTLTAPDVEGLAQICCSELIFKIEAESDRLISRMNRQLKVAPHLVLRGSTRSVESTPKPMKAPKSPTELDLGSWGNTYASIKKVGSPIWHQVDLRSYANHSLTRPHGWLGGPPLLHLPPGLRSIHGVPFKIMDEAQNEGRAVITFASPHTHTGQERLLPTRIRIPVRETARAIYFLHGCGWAVRIPFASYTLITRGGRRQTTNLVPLGGGSELLSKTEKQLQPNLQDWWPDCAQRRFPNAQPALITDPANPLRYERYIYSLEWILKKEMEIQVLEIIVDPEAGPTLALLAVSLLG